MATSAASKPFTVKGTRWMCTVRFVAFLLRQRGWAWVFTATNVRRAVRMAAPRRRRGVVRSCAVRLPVPACSAANANANASSSSKNKSSPQVEPRGRARRADANCSLAPRGRIRRRAGSCFLLLVSYWPLGHNSNWLCVFERAHSRRCYTLRAVRSTPVSHPSHCRRKPP